MSAEDVDWMRLASAGSDLEWNAATDGLFCGGCGGDDCHPGQPCGDVRGYDHGVCDLCPTRVETGEIQAVRGAS